MSNLLNYGSSVFNEYVFIYLIVLLILGFFILIKGADFFVDGSSAIAYKWGISSIVVGLTIVSMGTSAPEVSVSLLSALKGANNLAVSNVIGSNIFNLLVVLGVSSVLSPIKADFDILKRDFPINIFANILLILLAISIIPLNLKIYNLSHIDGLLMLLIFLIYISYLVYISLKANDSTEKIDDIDHNILKDTPTKTIFFFITIGMIGITIGGKFVVYSSVQLADKLHISSNLIGLTLVALGTSLPELVTSGIASLKGESDIAIGNVVGSNIFNLLLVLGISSSISSISGNFYLTIDSIILLFFTIFVFVVMYFRQNISKLSGLFFLLIYFTYLLYIIKR